MKTWVGLFLTIFTFGNLAFAGIKEGGGGSEEARIFTAIARKRVTLLLDSPTTQKYALQLLETLNNNPEVKVVSSLAQVCDQKAGVTDYAYSCRGLINLKQNPWANEAPGKGWLANETIAETHIKDILHEVFRASDPTSPNFVTNDGGFSATNDPTLNLSTVQIVTEAMVDVRNLFADATTNINWQDVPSTPGGPEYLLRTTYSFPSELTTKKQREDYPAGISCYPALCPNGKSSLPAGFIIRVQFSDPRLKVTYQLIDPRNGREVGREERRMILSFRGDTLGLPEGGKIDHDPELRIPDLVHSLGNYNSDFEAKWVTFDLSNKEDPRGPFTLKFLASGTMWRRLANVLPIVEQSAADPEKYVLRGFDFSKATDLKVIAYENNAIYGVKEQSYRVGAPESRFPTYIELYIKP